MQPWRIRSVIVSVLALPFGLLGAQTRTPLASYPGIRADCRIRLTDAEMKPGAEICTPEGHLAVEVIAPGLKLDDVWMAARTGVQARGLYALDIRDASVADSVVYAVLRISGDGGGYVIETGVAGTNAPAKACTNRGATIGMSSPIILGAFIAHAAERLAACAQAEKLKRLP